MTPPCATFSLYSNETFSSAANKAVEAQATSWPSWHESSSESLRIRKLSLAQVKCLRRSPLPPAFLLLMAEMHTDNLRNPRLLHGHAINHIRRLHHALGVRHQQELRILAHAMQQISEPAHVGLVQCRIHFVQHAEGRRLVLEDADQKA